MSNDSSRQKNFLKKGHYSEFRSFQISINLRQQLSGILNNFLLFWRDTDIHTYLKFIPSIYKTCDGYLTNQSGILVETRNKTSLLPFPNSPCHIFEM